VNQTGKKWNVIALILVMIVPIGLIFWWTLSVFRKRRALGYTTKNSWILIPRFKRHGALSGMNGGFSTFESSVGGKWLGL